MDTVADFLSSETEMESVANSTYSDTAQTATEEISTSISPALAFAEIVTLLVHAAYAPPTVNSAMTAMMKINLVFLIWLHLYTHFPRSPVILRDSNSFSTLHSRIYRSDRSYI